MPSLNRLYWSKETQTWECCVFAAVTEFRQNPIWKNISGLANGIIHVTSLELMQIHLLAFQIYHCLAWSCRYLKALNIVVSHMTLYPMGYLETTIDITHSQKVPTSTE